MNKFLKINYYFILVSIIFFTDILYAKSSDSPNLDVVIEKKFLGNNGYIVQRKV